MWLYKVWLCCTSVFKCTLCKKQSVGGGEERNICKKTCISRDVQNAAYLRNICRGDQQWDMIYTTISLKMQHTNCVVHFHKCLAFSCQLPAITCTSPDKPYILRLTPNTLVCTSSVRSALLRGDWIWCRFVEVDSEESTQLKPDWYRYRSIRSRSRSDAFRSCLTDAEEEQKPGGGLGHKQINTNAWQRSQQICIYPSYACSCTTVL